MFKRAVTVVKRSSTSLARRKAWVQISAVTSIIFRSCVRRSNDSEIVESCMQRSTSRFFRVFDVFRSRKRTLERGGQSPPALTSHDDDLSAQRRSLNSLRTVNVGLTELTTEGPGGLDDRGGWVVGVPVFSLPMQRAVVDYR